VTWRPFATEPTRDPTIVTLSRSLAAIGALALLPACFATQPRADDAIGTVPAVMPLKYSGPATSASITAGDLMTRLYVFADDSLMGREAGTEGHMKGTAYIERELRRMGLEPAGDDGSYFQNVPFIARRFSPTATLSVEGRTIAAFEDYVTNPFRGAFPRSLDGVPVVYGGTAGDSSLTAAQAAGKLVVLSTSGQPFRIAPNSPLGGAAAVALVVGPQLNAQVLSQGRVASMTLRPAAGSPAVATTLLITRGGAERLLGGTLEGLPAGTVGGTLRAGPQFVEADAPTRNVVAILRGSDPTLRGQFVAVGAHSDHIGLRAAGAVDHDSLHLYNTRRWFASENPSGTRLTPEQQRDMQARVAAIRVNHDSVRALRAVRRDSINNGADDDGSGSVTVLEVAEAFAGAPVRPRRSLLFVWHTGEEKGLLGSRWFADHPTVPRDSIVAQINIDMVGRGAATDLAAGGPTYLQLVGSRRLSTELGDLTETVNRGEPMPFTFDYTFDANGHPDNIYCRSDHYNYARYGIPVVFLTTGLHGDYHQVTDEPQYIDYPHMARVARLVRDLTDRVAGLDHRPVVDKPKPDPMGSCRQ
jgi:hypothetical protein